MRFINLVRKIKEAVLSRCAWFRGAGSAVKTGAVAAGTWFDKAGQTVKTGAITAGRTVGAWFRKTGPAVKTGAITTWQAAGKYLREAGSAVKTGAVAAGAWFRGAGSAVKTGAGAAGVWFREAGSAVKTGAVAAGAWFRGAGSAVKTGAITTWQAAGRQLRKAWPVIKTGAIATWQAAGKYLRKAWPVIKTGAVAAGAWFRGAGSAVKTGAIATWQAAGRQLRKAWPVIKTGAVAAGAWFRGAGSAVKDQAIRAGRTFRAIPWNRLGLLIKNRLKIFSRGEIPADRYRLFAGTGVLLILFLVNVFLLKQPDKRLSLQGITDRTLVFTQWWEPSLDTGVLEGLIGEFERQNPDIHVVLDTRSYTDVRGLLSGTDNVANDQAPDILGLDPLWFGETAVTEHLEPLPHYYKKSESSGGFYAGGEIPYEEWGRPLISFMMPLLYNIDLLEKAGFDRPPKDQADFTAFAKAVTEADRYGFAIALSPEDPRGLYRDILPWIRSSVSFTDWGGEDPFNTAAIRAALDLLNGLQKNGSLAPGSFTKTGKDRIGEFMAGRVAMLITSMADSRLLRDAGFNCGITAIPLRDAYSGKPLYALEQWYVGISRDTRYKDEALLFIGFLSEQVSVLSGHSGAVPWNSNTGGYADGSYAGESPLLSKAYDIYYTGETRTDHVEGWQSSLFETVMTEELRLMLEGGRSPEDTTNAIQRRLEAGN